MNTSHLISTNHYVSTKLLAKHKHSDKHPMLQMELAEFYYFHFLQ